MFHFHRLVEAGAIGAMVGSFLLLILVVGLFKLIALLREIAVALRALTSANKKRLGDFPTWPQ